MTKKITIAIDAMGGENAPDKTIEGVGLFINKFNNKKDYTLNLFGDEKKIKEKLEKYKINNNNIIITHTDSVVSDKETPITAVKNSKNTSMWNCIKSQLDGDSDISLSAGNTGVLLVISRMILKMMEDVSKPALAGLWPNKLGTNIVLDLGANIECTEQNLIDFAELGSALYKSLFPEDKANVSLLNVGSEEIKGTELLKNTSKKLAELSNENNFIFKGYIEGNEIMSGKSNVIVTKKSLKENLFSKISIIFSYFSLKKFQKKLDPRKYNGAIFLGLNGPVVKSHGGIDSLGFYHSIDLCYKIVKGNLMAQIKNNLSHLKNGKG